MFCLFFALVLWYALASAATFGVYGYDKHRSRTAAWRVKEKTLHTMELAGGWPGAMLAQRRFKHKRRKQQYMFTFRLIVAAHLLAWAFLFAAWVWWWVI